MPSELFNLSLALQIAIASGYLAYVIAYAGIRQHHTTADALLKSFAFGVIATATFTFNDQMGVATPLVAFVLPLGAGALWRWLGMKAWARLIRNSGINWADDIPTAWLSVTAMGTDSAPSQICVETIEGRLLLCDDTRVFKDAHQGPATFGLSGDVAFYVTAECRPNGEWIDKEDVDHSGYGGLLTYLPASQIKRVELRYLSAKVAKAAARKEKAGASESSAELNQEYKSDARPSNGSDVVVSTQTLSPAVLSGVSKHPRSPALLGAAAAVSSFVLMKAFSRRP